jgi:hypothetical protein
MKADVHHSGTAVNAQLCALEQTVHPLIGVTRPPVCVTSVNQVCGLLPVRPAVVIAPMAASVKTACVTAAGVKPALRHGTGSVRHRVTTVRPGVVRMMACVSAAVWMVTMATHATKLVAQQSRIVLDVLNQTAPCRVLSVRQTG